MARPGKEKAIAPAFRDELNRSCDAFVTAMARLRNAFEETSRATDQASRAVLEYSDAIIRCETEQQQQIDALFQRGLTEDPEMPKKRAKRAKRDPLMPKRPMTAYLLFCHQSRDSVKSDLGPGATHKDVVAELTKRWSDTTEEEKKGWQDVYVKNREVYARDMAQYKAAKEIGPGESSAIEFTAVNTEYEENPQESDAESDKAAGELADTELADTDLDVEVEEEDAEEEDEEEEIKSPTPPPRKKATPRSRKAATANGSLKQTTSSVVASTASPAIVANKVKAEPVKRQRASRKKLIEEEAASEEVAPKKKAARKRRKNSD